MFRYCLSSFEVFSNGIAGVIAFQGNHYDDGPSRWINNHLKYICASSCYYHMKLVICKYILQLFGFLEVFFKNLKLFEIINPALSKFTQHHH